MKARTGQSRVGAKLEAEYVQKTGRKGQEVGTAEVTLAKMKC